MVESLASQKLSILKSVTESDSDGLADGFDLRLTYLNGNVDSLTSGSHVATVGNDALARVTSAGPVASPVNLLQT